MSSRFALVAGVLLASLVSLPAAAQQSAGGALRDTTASKRPAPRAASSDSALVELGRAITALAVSVQTAVEETARNPEVRRAAVQTAGSAVSVAQRALAENTGEIERLLAAARVKLAELDSTQRAKQTAKP